MKSEEEAARCRICFDEEGILSKYCAWSGSIGLFHKECLQTWLESREDNHCEICKEEYNVEVVVTKYFKCNNFRKIPSSWYVKTAIMAIIILLCSTYFIAICFTEALDGDPFCIAAISLFAGILVLWYYKICRSYLYFLI